MQTTASSTKTYTIDEAHSTVRFWARHLMIAKVHGELPDVTGKVTFDQQNPSNDKIEATIKVASLTTKNDQRDGHLKSDDFLNADQFPNITFTSTNIERKSGNEFTITGDLTIRDKTKTVVFEAEASEEVKNPMGPGHKVGVTAKGQINREDFNVMWNMALETGGVVVGKDIHFEIDLELDRVE